MRLGLALASMMLGAAVPVHAQEPPDGYAEIIERAVGEFGEGHWAEARAHFERAHALFPNARTLRGIGMCAFELREYPEAVRFLERSLSDLRRALTVQQREATEALVRRAQAYVGYFLLETDPPGAELSVDDELPSRGPDGRVMLTLGEHVVVARAPGHHPARRRLEVSGGEDQTLTLALEPSGLGDPSPLSIALLVAGAGVLLVEPFSVGWWIDRESAASTCASPPEGFRCENGGVIGGQRDAAIVTSVVVGLTALGLAGVGLAIWLAGDTDPREELACAPTPAGLACRF